jgi:TolB-like protein/Flp pilus assembly protein TadD
MAETRKIAAILVADVVGYSRLAGADEEGTLARLRALRGDLIDPAIAAHHGRTVDRTGDGSLIEFRSVVGAVRCAIEVQTGMIERNAGLPPERRIEFRIGIHLGDVVEEADGALMGDGVNIAARLEGIAKSGAICLSEQAYWHVKGRLDLAVIDLGPTQLKNIVEPIRVYSLEVGAAAHAKPALVPAPEKPGPPRLSVVVLPFANIGGGPEQEYFVDGLTESLTTDVSRIPGSFVIARNTAFSYKGASVDTRAIGRDLNVCYVMEGSVQRSGSRMRVNVQLIDARSGAHLWADRFDKPLADLFDMQDEIVARLSNTLGTQVVMAEARRAERTPNPDSLDLYFQGSACIRRGLSPETLAAARSFYERALALDPLNGPALVGMGWADLAAGSALLTVDRTARLAFAEKTLVEARRMAPESAMAQLGIGVVQIYTNRVAQGIEECERALALDRNLALAHGYIGFAKSILGRCEETEDHVEQAIRLSPRDTYAYAWLYMSGFAKVSLGKDAEALSLLRRSIELNRSYPIAQFVLAAALAHSGRLGEAQSAVQAGLALQGDFTISRFRSGAASGDPIYLAQFERIINGLRKAGVPEQ